MKTVGYPSRDSWEALTKRPYHDARHVQGVVAEILADVRLRGDAALCDYHLRFHPDSEPELKVSPEFIASSERYLPDALKGAIKVAKANIERFHEAQRDRMPEIETAPGVRCWRRSVPIERVGLYIPGGSAPLFSTALMLGIPAVLAGCGEIVLMTPPLGNEGSRPFGEEILPIHPAIGYCAHLLGVSKVYRVGGAQAIAALAFGTTLIPRVFKIFGPGNQYVTCAKQQISMAGVAIDMPAGPSEVMILADSSAVPEFVAADLLSQAEHGTDSQVVLVSNDEAILQATQAAVAAQVEHLPRRAIAEEALNASAAVLLRTSEEMLEFANLYAPEHLIIAMRDAREVAMRVRNAGSVFLGNYTPESAGDYASGTNHTLPTDGAARAVSGVSLDSFVKKITFQEITREGLEGLSPTIQAMAAGEGLEGHRRAVSLRIGRDG